jgi:hypothetical protein
MNSFIITKLDGATFDLYDKSVPSTILSGNQNCQLLSDDTLVIQTKSAKPLPLSIGDKCTIYGKIYRVNTQPSVKKQGPRKFITDIVFEGIQYELLDAQFLLPDNTIGDSFTGNLRDFLDILIGNANRIGIWKIGDSPDNTEYKTLTFTGENCLSVLQRICEEWEQEFEIEQSEATNILHIRAAGVDFPYTFKYGSTGGLYELSRKNINSENVVTRLYAYGGSNNLGNGYLSERGCGRLCLPNTNKNSSFVQDVGVINNYGLKENTKLFDTIFPNRYGVVSALDDEDYLSFADNTMDFDLNEKEEDEFTTKYLIAGVSAKVHFNTGNLAGYEFELESYDNETQKLKLIPFEDENGMKFPSSDSAAFQFRPGDAYFFVDIRLPQAYITEAEEKLQAEATAYYAQNSHPRVQYELNIYDIFLRQFAAPVTVANLFAVGDYISVEDTDMGVSKSIRITGFTRDILKPYKYSITLGEAISKTTITRLIKDQKSVEEIIRFNKLNDPSRARRNWRSSQEVLSMVFDTEGDYYSDKIKPLSIETTMLQVGAKSMQFVLSNVVFEPNYQGNPNVIKVGGGQLVHYTIEDKIRTWDIATETVSDLQSDTPYYIYARCHKKRTDGNIIIDTEQRKVDYDYLDGDEDGYYTFLIGVLNSVETDGDGSNPGRLVSLTYGSSTINGRFIKTGRIESSGGTGSFIDLDNNQIRIGNSSRGLSWNTANDGRLVLKGTLVQSSAGDTQSLGFFRGEYNSSYTYYEGEQVTYQGSYYRYIYATPSSTLPTNTTYWTILAAKGEPGTNGVASDWKTLAYQKSATNPGSPYDTSPIPYGWQDYPDSQAEGDDKWWMIVAFVHWTGTEWLAGSYYGDYFYAGSWSEPIPVTGEQGTDGQFIDFKFCVTSDLNPPYWSDYLASLLNPDGWDDQPPQMPTGGAIWMIQAYKQAGGMTLIERWSAPVRISGEKGSDGKDGKEIEYVYSVSMGPEVEEGLRQATNNDDDYVPEGWTDDPRGVDETLKYEWVSTRKKVNGIWGLFSTPVLWAKWGDDGKDGKDGAFYERRFRETGSTTNWGIDPVGDNPSGWSTITPIMNDLQYLWTTSAKKNADGTLYIGETWSTPVRMTGERGTNGKIGPSPIYRGTYVKGDLYYGTEDRVDIVEYNGSYYVARVGAGEFSDVPPNDTGSWNPFGAQFESVATNLLLADYANIGGWAIRNQRLESQSGNTFLDGNNGLLSLAGGKILLKEDGSGQLANGGVAWDAGGNVIVTGKLNSNASGARVIINPSDFFSKIKIVDENEIGLIHIGFMPDDYAKGQILLLGEDGDTQAQITATGFSLRNANMGFGVQIDGQYLGVKFGRLPTSASGLLSGNVWRDGTTLRIVP